MELERPLIDETSLAANFTNEVGVAGTIRFLKNIPGLWLLQECRRAWEKQGKEYTYEHLTEMAATAEMAAIARKVRPHAACVVPEKRQERTTEGGLDAAGQEVPVG